MITKFRTWLEDSRDRLWFVPAILTLAAIGLVVLTLWADLRSGGVRPDGGPVGLIFRGGAVEAQAVLAAIAGGIITVTGVVFSITLVTLRAASEQFSPRLLRQFTSDRPSQLTLGVFTATFVYSLMVLRSVRAESEVGGPFVPSISVTVAFALALVAIGFLIFFIGYLAREIQAASVVERVTKGIHQRIDHLFPEEIGLAVAPADVPVPIPSESPAVVRARQAGYVREVDEEALFEHAHRHLLLRMEVGVGTFVVPGMPLLSVWPAERVDTRIGSLLHDAFVIGRERTIHHDVEHGFIELSDIAVKAMSPGINDPTTATACIDRMSEALVALGRRDFPSPVRVGDDGHVWMIAMETDFERVVHISFNPIRHYGRGDPGVLRRLLEALERVATCVPEARHAPLRAQAEAILRQAGRTLEERIDQEQVRLAATWLHRTIEDRARGEGGVEGRTASA